MPSAPTRARRACRSRAPLSVTEDERTGRRITIGIAWLAGAPPVILLAAFIAAGDPVLKTTVISDGLVPVVLAWLLIKGRRWVRSLVVLGFGVNAAAALAQLLRLDWTLSTMLLMSTEAVVHGLAAIVLVLSPQVRAFFEYQNRLASLNLSGA